MLRAPPAKAGTLPVNFEVCPGNLELDRPCMRRAVATLNRHIRAAGELRKLPKADLKFETVRGQLGSKALQG
jgi:hypothetical protein